MASIKRRSSTSYQITVSAGRTPTGKQILKYRTVKVNASWSERQKDRYVQEQAAIFERRILGGANVEHDNLKFRDFALDLYMNNYGNTLKAKTRRQYEIILSERLIPYFGEMQIRNITTLDVTKWLASLERADGTGRALSENSKGVWFRTLSAILGKAYEWNLIDDNPCRRIKAPRKAHSDVSALQLKDAKIVIDKLNLYTDIRVSTLVGLLIFTGAREAEVAGMEWRDICFDDNSLSVRREVLYIPGVGLKEDTPKSKSGIRVIYFPEILAEILKKYKEYHNSFIKEQGGLWVGATGERAKLFTKLDGTPIFDSTIRKWVKKYMSWAGVPYITVHGLRHTYASILISNGNDARAVAAQLGHSTPVLVYNTYANPQECSKRKTAETLDNLFRDENA